MGSGTVDMDVWHDLAVDESTAKVVSHHSWALSVSPDRKWACIAMAGRRRDGLRSVGWKEHRPGTDWIAATIKDLWSVRKVPLRIAANSAEASLIDDIRELGVDVEEIPTATVARCTGEFIDAVANRDVCHLGQSSLDTALEHAQLKTTEAGASVWAERSSSIEISPLKAVTVALGGVGEPEDMSAISNVW